MPVVVFCLFFVFQEISTKRSPNATKLFDDFFLDIRDPRSFGGGSEDEGVANKPPGCALVPYGALVAPFDVTLPL